MKKYNEDLTLVKRELIYKGSIIDYYKDDMLFSNGNTARWDYVDHKPVVSFLPIDIDTGKIVCVKQFRHPVEQYCIEIPAGGILDGEEPLTGALRELEEETGYKLVGEASHLVDIYTSVGYCNEKIYIYYGNVKKVKAQSLDENEFVNVECYELNELKRMILSGEIEDGKTVSAIMSYYSIVVE